MNSFTHVPPEFRFHPTDEELVDYYLRKKIASKRIDLDVIKDIDLYKIEPWDLQELCRIGAEEQNEWYFFSHKDKKYPTGTRTNRATKAGFWKATGRDKAIYLKHSLIGMRKTLVFYQGRAPNGQKSDWIMHEYRLETNENAPSQEEGWVVCRVFKKRMATTRKEGGEHDSPYWYDDQASFMPDFDPTRRISPPFASYPPHHHTCKQELQMQYKMPNNVDAFLQLPDLESPKLQQSGSSVISCHSIIPYGLQDVDHIQEIDQMHHNTLYINVNNEQAASDQVTDWRVLDKFVASQLSQDDGNDSNEGCVQVSESMGMMENEMKAELTSTSTTTTSQFDLWK